MEYEYIDLVILASLRLCGIFLPLRRQALPATADRMEAKAGRVHAIRIMLPPVALSSWGELIKTCKKSDQRLIKEIENIVKMAGDFSIIK